MSGKVCTVQQPLPQSLTASVPGMQCRCPPHHVDQPARLQSEVSLHTMHAWPGARPACPFASRLALRLLTARPQNCWKQRQSGRYPATCLAAGNGSAAAEGALQDSLAGKAAKEEDRLPPWALTFDLRERETGAPSLNKTDTCSANHCGSSRALCIQDWHSVGFSRSGAPHCCAQ